MKKFTILFVLLCSVSFATEVVKPGVPFKAEEEGLFFSLTELNVMKEKMERIEKNEALLTEYKALVEDYKKMRTLQDSMVSQYKDLDKMKQESINIYRESITSYKTIIGELKDNNTILQKQANTTVRRSRFQRNLNFVLGFVAPILGARAFNWVK